MEYGTQSAPVGCGNCGEPAEGRYCRMCGMPVDAVAGQPTAAYAALPGYAGYAGYAGTRPASPSTAESTQAMPAVTDYGPEPTQLVGTLPTAPTQPPAEFDSLFRNPDGSPGLHGQTQMLPPVVETDYRMEPPGGGTRVAPGTQRGAGYPHEDDEPGTNRTVMFAILGAVLVAAAVILGLLYLGSQSTSNTGASGAATTPAGTAGASQGAGVISVPTNGATVAPTTAASTAPTTAALYHGDNFPLGPGSSGSWVKWVQEKLKDLGYYDGSATGSYTQATELAVQQFQVAAGVVGDPAGVVGSHTRLALTAAGSTPDLKPGEKSSAVTRLNASLKLAEGADLSGSRYTTQTAIAVARYQAAVGLTPTGQVDASTWAKLQAGTIA